MEASTETDRGSLSWWQRAAIGLILGGVFGVLEFLPAFSVFGFASAAAAGAIGYSTLAAVVPAFHRWPIVECVVCALIGACAGLVWLLLHRLRSSLRRSMQRYLVLWLGSQRFGKSSSKLNYAMHIDAPCPSRPLQWQRLRRPAARR